MIKPDLAVNFAGIDMVNPIMAASGPFGSGLEYPRVADPAALGAIIVKGISDGPWEGNPAPRLAETPAGMLNAIGLQNPGFENFRDHDLSELLELGPKIIVNVIGRDLDEYAAVTSKLDTLKGIAGIELNISCPNLKAGGMSFGADPLLTAEVVRAVRASTSLPLLVKLSPNVTDITVIAKAAEDGGADAISLINTLGGMAIDIASQKPRLGNCFGGLSGPAIKPVALKMVWQVSSAVKIPVLGMGGITSAEDAIEFILAGASSVAVGTGFFYDPQLPLKITCGMIEYMKINDIPSIEAMRGMAKKGGGI